MYCQKTNKSINQFNQKNINISSSVKSYFPSFNQSCKNSVSLFIDNLEAILSSLCANVLQDGKLLQKDDLFDELG